MTLLKLQDYCPCDKEEYKTNGVIVWQYLFESFSMKHTIEKIRLLTANMGVLLVEDERTAKETIARVFERLFANTFTASNADEAISVFTENKKDIDIVVTDIFLGEKSGFDIIEQIKKKSKGVKFIVISGYELTSNFTRAIELEVDSFILKPIATDSLLFSVNKAAKKIETERELARNRKELQQAKERAMKLLAAQDDFIKDAIHELHTPLSIIVTNADLIAMTHGEMQELSAIQAACKVLQTSYEDMAYMMKKDSGQFTDMRIDLGDFLKERVMYFKSIADANNVSLECGLDVEGVELDMSDIKLQRLVDNNISNAIKYSKRSMPVSVRLYASHGRPTLEFHNFGPVIQDKKKIFKRYYREENSKGGYGIGLRLVHDICGEYGIDIEVSSDEEGGNFFRYKFSGSQMQQ